MRRSPSNPPDLMARRGKCLALAMALEFMVGLNYAYSVLQIPLMEKFNVPLSTLSFIAGLCGILGALFSLFISAWMRRILGFKKMVIIGGFLFGLTFISTAINQRSLFFLVISLLVLRSVGSQMVDVPVKSYAVELYPDRSGRASGLTTSAYGAAAIVWAPLVTALITRVGNLSGALYIIGGTLMVVMMAIGFCLIPVPSDFHTRFQRDKSTEIPDRYYSADRAQMLRLPIFYLLLGSLMFAMASGNALLTQFAYYMEALLNTSAETAALSVSALALANMLGRIIFGTVSDRIGMLNTALITQILSAAALFACSMISSPLGFTVAAMMVIFSFGGMYSLLSPLNREIFGQQHMTENFPVIVVIPNLAVMLGPFVASFVIDRTNSLSLTMLTCAVMGTAGALFMLLIMKKLKAVQKVKK